MDSGERRLLELKTMSRMTPIANQYLYDNVKRLTSGQIQTLIQRPEVMDWLVGKLGTKMVSVLMGQPMEQPTGLIEPTVRLPEGVSNG